MGERVSLWDNACGTGMVTKAFNLRLKAINPTWSIVCTDISEGMVATARETAKEEGWANVDVRVADSQVRLCQYMIMSPRRDRA
jgi:ubiquinone/menaquinone biosynthesis C-methylase UbiE